MDIDEAKIGQWPNIAIDPRTGRHAADGSEVDKPPITGAGTCKVEIGHGSTAGWWVCQSCGELFDVVSALACKKGKKPNYCPTCGRKVDR